jgi:D-cysteine desulfhydrase
MTLLHDRVPALAASVPRVAICDLPTPVRPLTALGEGLWMKDDSRSAPLWGGNKPRKLEWVIADAQRRGRGTILTFGALATNHGLATALYAREHGLRCALALVDQPRDEHVERQLARLGASGATLHFTHSSRRTMLALPWLLVRHRGPYVLPAGGSSPVGAIGFVEAALELAAQVERGELPVPETVWCALGTGGTAAGLAVGLRLAGLPTRVCAVHVNDTLRLDESTILRLARRTHARLGLATPPPAAGDVEVVHGYLGGGYGHRIAAGDAATERAREAAGPTLDPVYTAKAFAAVLDRHDGRPALYWHTFNAVRHPRVWNAPAETLDAAGPEW